MWYVLPDSNKQYPLTIERVRKIRQLNLQNNVPDSLEPVEVSTGKPKEDEGGFVDLVGQISLKTLEKADRKKRHGHQKPGHQRQGSGQGQQGGGQQGGNGGQQGGRGEGRDNREGRDNKDSKNPPPPGGRNRRR